MRLSEDKSMEDTEETRAEDDHSHSQTKQVICIMEYHIGDYPKFAGGGHPTGNGENCRKRQAFCFHEHQGISVLYPFIILFLVPIKL